MQTNYVLKPKWHILTSLKNAKTKQVFLISKITKKCFEKCEPQMFNTKKKHLFESSYFQKAKHNCFQYSRGGQPKEKCHIQKRSNTITNTSSNTFLRTPYETLRMPRRTSWWTPLCAAGLRSRAPGVPTGGRKDVRRGVRQYI